MSPGGLTWFLKTGNWAISKISWCSQSKAFSRPLLSSVAIDALQKVALGAHCYAWVPDGAIKYRQSDCYFSCLWRGNLQCLLVLFNLPPVQLSPPHLGGDRALVVEGAARWAGFCRGHGASGWKAQRNSKSLSWSRTRGTVQRANADALSVSVIDVFPVPVRQCVEFFLKSERPAGSSLLFLNPFPRWDEKCNTFQLTSDFLQKYFWKRILHVEHMKTVRGWERARF